MSQDHTVREKLVRLADAIMQDILETPDADIIAEVDAADIERARTILIEVKMNVSKQLLSKAKAQHEVWSTSHAQTVILFDGATARSHFEKIRRGDPEFNQKITLAARNGKAPSDNDIEGFAEDWDDLQRLDGEEPME
jgi:frataxin-like iron-binding protein CyaY